MKGKSKCLHQRVDSREPLSPPPETRGETGVGRGAKEATLEGVLGIGNTSHEAN